MVTILALLSVLGGEDVDPAGIAFFEKKIRPVLVEHCYKCHSVRAAELGGNLRLDSRQGARRGGPNGPAVTPFRVERSLLIQAIRHESLEMPPDNKLPDRVIADFVRWVEIGAPDPRDGGGERAEADSWATNLEALRDHWSLQPVLDPPLPAVRNAEWSSNPVDRFILAKLEQAGLEPARPADRPSLIRRLSFALTGLPPTPQDIQAFVNDHSNGAHERLVDRLLASPHFGERWARHWMDVVRFTETHGHEWNFEVRGAWRYRDYLIRAFNQDLSYDHLVREHIAGDLLAAPRWNDDEQINESLIGTAFYRFGEVGHDNCLEFREISLDVVDNQIDTLTKAFQGLTVSCARCHDHKFDPVSTRDYYALSGILSSSRPVAVTIDAPGVYDDLKEQLGELKSQIRHELAVHWLQDVRDSKAYLLAAQAERLRGQRFDKTLGSSPNKAAADQPGQITGVSAELLDKERLSNWVSALQALHQGQSPPEHPLSVWQAMQVEAVLLGKPGSSGPKEFRDAWHKLASKYEQENRRRVAFNNENFRPFGSFGGDTPDAVRWHRAGLGLIDGVCGSGGFSVAHDGDQLVRALYPAGVYSHRLTSRLNGALRSPFLPKDRKFISVQVVGGGDSALRLIYDNCHLGVNIELLESDQPKWISKPTLHEYGDSNVYAALVTKFDNQSFPKYNTQERIDPDDIHSYFGVTRAVLHDCDEPPREELTHLMPLFVAQAVRSINELAERYQQTIARSISNWADDQASDADVRWINWLLKDKLITNSIKTSERLSELVTRYRAIEARIPPPKLVNGMADLDRGFDVPLRVRGNPFELGETVPRRYLEVLGGSGSEFVAQGSGRRLLAEKISNRQNPLTARVMVNRVWHHLFGAGIVRTTDDFGSLGQRPSHPELLDFLARQFAEQDWSLKRLIRSLVLTKTYRMSSRRAASASELDPGNRLLHHFPLRRLEAEAIRDAILAASSRLDRRLYGRSIHPYRLQERKDRRLFRGPLDGLGRRSLYTKVTLTEEPPLLTVFNFPEPKVTRGRRDQTNVPAQALALLNDPFVNQQAGVWAEQLVGDDSASLTARIERMFLTALARPPGGGEQRRFIRLVDKLAQFYQVPPDKLLSDRAIWKSVAHTMFNLKEFIYLR